MGKYKLLIADLESSMDSFNAVAKRHNVVPATAYNAIAKVRPDLLGPRSVKLGFSQVSKTEVPDSVRAEALAQVLAGRSVKDVANETGVPAPTLYQMARKARDAQAAKVEAGAKNSSAATHSTDPILDILLASVIVAAAQRGVTPADVCDLLKARLNT